MSQRYTFASYDFTLTPGGSQVLLCEGDYFRIQSSTGGVSVTVEGFGTLPGLLTGQGLQDSPFKRLVLKDVSGAANAGTILVSGANFIDNRTYGVTTISAPVALDAATQASLKLPTPRPEAPNNFFTTTGALAANTARQIVNPASNINGLLLLSAVSQDTNTSFIQSGFIAKSSAPVSITDGDLVAICTTGYAIGTSYEGRCVLQNAQSLAAGQGLYYISTPASTTLTSARWKLL